MKVGLPALKQGRACSRWGRPSFVSSSTQSTRFSSSSMESTISTSSFFISSIYPGTRSVLEAMSGLPLG
jgi:hypothetical protein